MLILIKYLKSLFLREVTENLRYKNFSTSFPERG